MRTPKKCTTISPKTRGGSDTPPGLTAGRVHLEKLINSIGISQGELALMKMDAFIDLQDAIVSSITLQEKGYRIETLDDRINAIIHMHLKEAHDTATSIFDEAVEL